MELYRGLRQGGHESVHARRPTSKYMSCFFDSKHRAGKLALFLYFDSFVNRYASASCDANRSIPDVQECFLYGSGIRIVTLSSLLRADRFSMSDKTSLTMTYVGLCSPEIPRIAGPEHSKGLDSVADNMPAPRVLRTRHPRLCETPDSIGGAPPSEGLNLRIINPLPIGRQRQELPPCPSPVAGWRTYTCG
jgi:hypothetical protein